MLKTAAINQLKREYRDFVAITSTNSNLNPSDAARLDALLQRSYVIKNQFEHTEEAAEEKENDNDDEQTLLLLNIELKNVSIRRQLDALEDEIENADDNPETYNRLLQALTSFGSTIEGLLNETYVLPTTDEQRTVLLALNGTWDILELLSNTLNTQVTGIAQNDSDDEATQKVNCSNFYHSPVSLRIGTVTPADYLNNKRSSFNETKETDSQSTEIYDANDNSPISHSSPINNHINKRTQAIHPSYYWTQPITLSGHVYGSSNANNTNNNSSNNTLTNNPHK